jgi:hypothetical protein
VAGEQDTRLVDYLYGELSKDERASLRRSLESDAELRRELESLEGVLAEVRTVPDEEPSPHLDALILAHARQEAGERAPRGWLKKLFAIPAIPVAVAGTLAALVAIVVSPVLTMHQMAPERAMTTSAAPAAQVDMPQSPPPQAPHEEVAGDVAAERPPEPDPAEHAAPKPEAPRRAASARQPEAYRSSSLRDAKSKDERGPVSAETPKAKKPAPMTAPVLSEERLKKGESKELDAPTHARENAPRPAKADDSSDLLEAKQEDAEMANKVVGGQKNADKKARAVAAPPAEPAASTPAPATTPAPAPAQGQALSQSANEVQELARSMIRAADGEIDRGDRKAARATLHRALDRTRGTPSMGEVLLRIAELDEIEGKLALAIQDAEQAYAVPMFTGKLRALELVDRVSRKSGDKRSFEWVEHERAVMTH